nr:integrin alpha-4-like [Procambarus clarkii]
MQGTVTTVQEDSDWNIIDSRYKRRKRSNIFFTKTNVFTPSSQVQQLEYFDHFACPFQVYIFKRGDETRMEVEWVGLGSQLGSGYGHAVAAGDVTGDGWSELLVGAPLYAPNIAAQGSKAETSEAGMVVVYGRGGVGDLREVGVLQGAPLAPGARFGSTISVVGDLDRDGFNDVAVGAPYEDGGRGAVYIYRGGADGLQTKLSQKILASDLSQALKGFGVAISRGVDVDQNGYVDVGVGAYSGSKGAAAVLRTRTVATVASRVVSTVAVITELRAEVRLALCLTYDGKQVQKRVGMDVNGTVDENLTPRATFVTTNTSHVISKATLEQGVETCLTFVLNMKENLQDLERPLEVTFKFHSDDFDPGRPWCVECSVLAPWASTSAKISFPLALGCGTDGVCNPDLTITAAWTSGLASGRYTVGSLNPLTITVKVKARGEPAYLGWVQMSLPPGLGIRTLPYSCKIINSTTAYCTLQNPFYQREETLELELQEEEGEMKGVLGMSVGGPAKMVEVKVEAGATGTYPQTLSLPLPLSYDVQLSLEGYADVEYYFYDPNIPAPKVNSEVTFKAENSGVTGVTSVVVEVLVPLAYSPPSGEANVTFGTLTKLLVIPEGGLNLCRMGDPETIMGGVGVGVETSFPPTETELKVTCGIVGVVCGRVLCTLSGLHQGPRVLLQAEYNLTMLITRYGPNTTVGIHTWASLTNSSSGTNTR